MLEQYIRPSYQKYFVDPLASWISNQTTVKPNLISLLSIILGILAALLLIARENMLSCLFLLFSGYLDTLDGTLARIKNCSSKQGTVIDIVGDRIVEIAIIFGLLCIAPNLRIFPIFWMLASSLLCITTFLVVGIFASNESEKSFYYSPGLMERPEAFAFFIVMILIPSLFFYLAWIYTVLVSFTGIYRMIEFIVQPRRQHGIH